MPTDLEPLITSLWNYGDPAGSEARFAAAEAELPPDAPLDSRLQLRTQRARALGLQRKFDEAFALLAEIAPQLSAETPVAAVRHALELGRAYRSSGKPADSLPHFHRAFELAQACGEDGLAVDALHMLGIADDPARCREWNERALALAAASPSTAAQRWEGSLCNNMGFWHFDRGEYEDALQLFQQGLASRLKFKQRVPSLIARWTIAKAWRMMGRVEEALAEQCALEKEWQADGGGDGYVFEEKAECLLALGRSEEAGVEFLRAHALLSKDTWLAANEFARLERMLLMGKTQSVEPIKSTDKLY